MSRWRCALTVLALTGLILASGPAGQGQVPPPASPAAAAPESAGGFPPGLGNLSPALKAKIEEAKEAAKALATTHFFAGGHGMHVIPDMRTGARKLMDAQEKYGHSSRGKSKHSEPVQKAADGSEELTPEARDSLENRMGFPIFENKPVGLLMAKQEGVEVGVVTCVACHSGRAAGQFVMGLGNKRIDMTMVGQISLEKQEKYMEGLSTYNRKVRGAQRKAAEARKYIPLGKQVAAALEQSGFDEAASKIRHKIRSVQRQISNIPSTIRRPDKELADDAINVAKFLADDSTGNLTQGLVSMAHVHGWFFNQSEGATAPASPMPSVKVPHLWGLTQKRRAGLLCDGMADGVELGWFAATELAVGQTPETVRSYLPQLNTVAEKIDALLPPPYPLPVDKKVAYRGFIIFRKLCVECHGNYKRDEIGVPIFDAPKHVPILSVGTDPAREAAVTQALREQIAKGPLNDVMKCTPLQGGYLAPRLEGVWARFPYLHNGSVPTLHHLLTPEERPAAFSLADAGEKARFDAVNVGLTVPPAGSPEASHLEEQGKQGDRTVYWTGRPGHSSAGHEFGTALKPDEKLALIEYLKCL